MKLVSRLLRTLTWYALLVILFFAVVIYPGSRLMKVAHNSLCGPDSRGCTAHAESLHFADLLPQKQILLNAARSTGFALKVEKGSHKRYWQLPGGTPHQNEVLKKCQDGLRARGIEDVGVQRYGCGILVSENERLDPLRLGDGGHAFGICQRNLGRVWAKDFLARHPEWKTVEVQLAYCNDRFAAAYKKYGNLFQATVEHNSPAAAARKRDACHISPCYYKRVQIATEKLSLTPL